MNEPSGNTTFSDGFETKKVDNKNIDSFLSRLSLNPNNSNQITPKIAKKDINIKINPSSKVKQNFS